MSRPRFAPSDQQRQLVKSLAAYGIGQEEIARKIGVSSKTLRRHFREELDRGATDANAQVAQTIYKMATSGEFPAASIFWLKCRAGWRQNGRVGREAQQTVPFVVEVRKGPGPTA
jgi:AraC-like DNA-binding protein